MTRFESRLAEAEALAFTEQKDKMAAAANKRLQQELRQRLEAHMLPSVERIAAFALRSDVRATAAFAAPSQGKSHAAFVRRASHVLDAARAHQQELYRHGVTHAQVTELTRTLDEFLQVAAQVEGDVPRHRETRSKLSQALAELAELLGVLDAYNRMRFQDDAGQLASWVAVRTVGKAPAGRSRKTTETVAPATPALQPPASTEPIPSAPTPAAASDDEQPPRSDPQRSAA